MLGNLAISVICGTVYGVTALVLGLPYPLAVAVIAGILDLIQSVGATIAGLIIGLVALSVSLQALIVFVIVMVVYQQIENYIVQRWGALALDRARHRPQVRRHGLLGVDAKDARPHG